MIELDVSYLKKFPIFTILFSATIFILLLDYSTTFSFTTTLRKIKYVYFVVMTLLCVKDLRITRSSIRAYCILFLLIFHSLLFGLVLVNKDVILQTREHLIQNIIFYYFVFITFTYVMQNNIYKLFVDLSFTVCGIHLLLISVMHLDQFANPFWGIVQSFQDGYRYKSSFGFIHPGYLSNYIYFVLTLSLLFWTLHRNDNQNEKKYNRIKLVVIDGISILMLCSAAERSAIISTGIAYILFFLFYRIKKLKVPRVRVFSLICICFMLLIFFQTSLWDRIWMSSNRELNIAINYPVFKQLGNFWTGMGYVESHLFQSKYETFKLTTSSLDMYYVYLYFTTGFLGCVIQTIAHFLLFKRLFMFKNSIEICTFSIYVSLLFLSFWAPALFTYDYFSSFFFLLIILFGTIDGNCLNYDNLDSSSDKHI